MQAAIPAREVVVGYWGPRDEPWRGYGTLAACAALGAAAGYVADSLAMGLLSAMALALAMWKCWLPISVRLSPSGITVSCLRVRRTTPWRDVGRVEQCPGGVLLWGKTPTARFTRRPRLYLPWPRHPEWVEQFHREYQPSTSPRGSAVRGQGTPTDPGRSTASRGSQWDPSPATTQETSPH